MHRVSQKKGFLTILCIWRQCLNAVTSQSVWLSGLWVLNHPYTSVVGTTSRKSPNHPEKMHRVSQKKGFLAILCIWRQYLIAVISQSVRLNGLWVLNHPYTSFVRTKTENVQNTPKKCTVCPKKGIFDHFMHMEAIFDCCD